MVFSTRFHSTRVKRGHPPRQEGQMDYLFVPFVVSCFDSCVSIGSFLVQTNSTIPNLLRKILNLVVQGPREPWEPKVWAFVVNQRGQNLHHDQAFFSPIYIYIYIYIIIYFILFYFQVLRSWKFCQFFSPKNVFYSHFTLEKKKSKFSEFFGRRNVQNLSKEKKTHTNYHQWFKFMPIFFNIKN